jgi:hypothetical protein
MVAGLPDGAVRLLVASCRMRAANCRHGSGGISMQLQQAINDAMTGEIKGWKPRHTRNTRPLRRHFRRVHYEIPTRCSSSCDGAG